VAGGKLTTYRQMAADAVDAAAKHTGDRSRSRTKRLRLLGAAKFDRRSRHVNTHLQSRYGTASSEVESLMRKHREWAEPLVAGLPYVRAEVVWAVRHEMADTVDDVLSRRTRARLLARDDAADAARSTAELMAGELGWSNARIDHEVEAFLASIRHERDTPGLHEVHRAPHPVSP
jgi:glycerol-3-phosphate dehydrogenase